MDMKKVFVLGLLLVVAVSAVAAISATEEVALDGIHFKLPNGYNPYESDTDAAELGDSEDIDGTIVDKVATSEYINAAGDKLEFKVGEKNGGINSINPLNAQNKTIAGKNGFLIKELDDGKEKYKFKYLQDGKLVRITAVSVDIINQTIV